MLEIVHNRVTATVVGTAAVLRC